jgi:hypothetical protein
MGTGLTSVLSYKIKASSPEKSVSSAGSSSETCSS